MVGQGFLGAKAGHPDRAGRRVEESCRGFFVSNWLCSKPGKSLCERIHLVFSTASRCLHSLSFGRHDRFCVWKLLFYQQPCAKAQEFCKAEFLDSMSVLALELSTLFPNSAPLNSGLWLTAFGKSGLFRCQSTFATRFC